MMQGAILFKTGIRFLNRTKTRPLRITRALLSNGFLTRIDASWYVSKSKALKLVIYLFLLNYQSFNCCCCCFFCVSHLWDFRLIGLTSFIWTIPLREFTIAAIYLKSNLRHAYTGWLPEVSCKNTIALPELNGIILRTKNT